MLGPGDHLGIVQQVARELLRRVHGAVEVLVPLRSAESSADGCPGSCPPSARAALGRQRSDADGLAWPRGGPPFRSQSPAHLGRRRCWRRLRWTLAQVGTQRGGCAMSTKARPSTRVSQCGSAECPGGDDRLSDWPVGTNGWKVEGPAKSGAVPRRAGERSSIRPSRNRVAAGGDAGPRPVAPRQDGAPMVGPSGDAGAPGTAAEPRGKSIDAAQLHDRPVGAVPPAWPQILQPYVRGPPRLWRKRNQVTTNGVTPGVTGRGVGVRSEAVRCPADGGGSTRPAGVAQPGRDQGAGQGQVRGRCGRGAAHAVGSLAAGTP